MRPLFLVFFLIFSEIEYSRTQDGNEENGSNATFPMGEQNFSDSTVNSTASLPDTWLHSNETLLPDQTDQSDAYPGDVGTDFPTTSTTQSKSTPAPREPQPLSHSLPNPNYSVSTLCPCNEQEGSCEVNCCCDPDCTEETALFTSCTVDKVIVDPQLCTQDVAVYSLSTNSEGYTSVQSSVNSESSSNIFCIQKANYEAGLSYATPETPTDLNFDSLFRRFARFFFSSSEFGRSPNQDLPLTLVGYLYGDTIKIKDNMHYRESLQLPTAAGTSYCLDENPAAFLQDDTNTCTRSFDLVNDCSTLPALNLQTYTGFQVVSEEIGDSMQLVPVEVTSIILKSLDGVQTSVDPSNSSLYTPQVTAMPPSDANSTVCNNVVLQVQYTVLFSEVGGITKVEAEFVLGPVMRSMLPIQQTFQIQFLQESMDKKVFRYSGNPGYIVGLPVVTGTKGANGIEVSTNPKAALTVIQSSGNQDCLTGTLKRSPVLFGVDTVSGCTLRLIETSNCSVLIETLIGVLRGNSPPDHVASFGNSPPKNTLDWVPIQNQTSTTFSEDCSVPLSRHLEVRWTKYGRLINPQAQIVSVTELMKTNASSLALLSGANGFVPVTTSVAFVDVSAPAEPGYRAPPTIDAKLPFDFFFPFV